MSCETLEFSLSVVAVRHLCILTHTGLPSPQSGESEVRSMHLPGGPHLPYLHKDSGNQADSEIFTHLCNVIESRFSLVFVVFLSNT